MVFVKNSMNKLSMEFNMETNAPMTQEKESE